jgi:hypothetical protein
MSRDIKNCVSDESITKTTALIEDVVMDTEEELEWYVRMKAEELNIVSIDQDLVSIFCNDENYVAIAKSSVTLMDGRKYSRFGYANADTIQTDNPEILATLALAEATFNAISSVEDLPVPCEVGKYTPVSRVSPIGQVEHDHVQMEEYRRRHAEEISIDQPDSRNRMTLDQDPTIHEVMTRRENKAMRLISTPSGLRRVTR